MNDLLIRTEGLVAGWARPVTAAFDLDLRAGEIVGLSGPNGVGKSTVLAALAGRARIFSGQVDQRPGLHLALQTQEVPPLDGLPLSGRELLALTGADVTGLPPWLADRLDTRLDCLSGGQRHYLALWAVLMAAADVVLLDEPTNNLDAAGVEHLVGVLRRLADAGRALLVVSHDAAFVTAACDRVLILESGNVA